MFHRHLRLTVAKTTYHLPSKTPCSTSCCHLSVTGTIRPTTSRHYVLPFLNPICIHHSELFCKIRSWKWAFSRWGKLKDGMVRSGGRCNDLQRVLGRGTVALDEFWRQSVYMPVGPLTALNIPIWGQTKIIQMVQTGRKSSKLMWFMFKTHSFHCVVTAKLISWQRENKTWRDSLELQRSERVSVGMEMELLRDTQAVLRTSLKSKTTYLL